MPPLQDNQ